MSPSALTVAELAEHLRGRVVGDGSPVIVGMATLDRAGPQHASFLTRTDYLAKAIASATRRWSRCRGSCGCYHGVLADRHPLLDLAEDVRVYAREWCEEMNNLGVALRQRQGVSYPQPSPALMA